MSPPVHDPDWLGRWSVIDRGGEPPVIRLGPSAARFLQVSERDEVYATEHRRGLLVYPAARRETVEGPPVTPPPEEIGALGRWRVQLPSDCGPVIRLGRAAVDCLGLAPGDKIYAFEDPGGVRVVSAEQYANVGGPAVPPPADGGAWSA